MQEADAPENKTNIELPDRWWYKVYVAVIVTTIVVITLLWAFSRYFSD